MRKRLLCLLMVFILLSLSLPFPFPANAMESETRGQQVETPQVEATVSAQGKKQEDEEPLPFNNQHPVIAEKNELWNTEAERALIEEINAENATLLAMPEVNSKPWPWIERSYSASVTVGTIRYISQLTSSSYFYKDYWPSSSFGYYKAPIQECGTASLSMALSYIGVNKTPKEILTAHNGQTVFQENWGVAEWRSPAFSVAVDNYVNGNGRYSPPVIYLNPSPYSNNKHFVVVAAQISSNQYVIIDPANNKQGTMTITGNSWAQYSCATKHTAGSITAIYQYYNPNPQSNVISPPSLNISVSHGIATLSWNMVKNADVYDVEFYKGDQPHSSTDWLHKEGSLSGDHLYVKCSPGCYWAKVAARNSKISVPNNYTFSSEVHFAVGDVDEDGRVTSKDAQMIINVILEKDGPFTERQVSAADVDGNGVITTMDAQAIINYTLEKTDGSAPIEKVGYPSPFKGDAPDFYTVSYDANGGNNAPEDQTKWYDQSLTLSNSYPTRTGYNFEGWSTSYGGSVEYQPGDAYFSNNDMRLYAVWISLPTYTVAFEVNGGHGTPDSQTKQHDQNIMLSDILPTRSGYNFEGWATSRGGSVEYQPGDTYFDNSNLTLYAVWTQIPTYTVSYDANGGIGAPYNQTKQQEQSLTLSETRPTRFGYNFAGWATYPGGSVQYQPGDSYFDNSDLTLYAIWIASPTSNLAYAVLYDDGTLVFQRSATPESGRSMANVFPVDLNGYDESAIPWYDNRADIKRVEFLDIVQPTSTAYWFHGCKYLETIKNLNQLDTSHVTNMQEMFGGCSNLTALDVSGFNTSNVTNMNCMFQDCSKLVSLDVSGFKTARVTDIRGLFYGCENLTAIDVTGFDTSSVISMNHMFYECRSLDSVDVTGFDTSNVKYINDMFYGCVNLTSLDITSFDTSKAYEIQRMFTNCSHLVTIYASDKFVTVAASDSCKNSMFEECVSLVGGKGTTYNPNDVGSAYARIDNPPNRPGYFTDKNSSSPVSVSYIEIVTPPVKSAYLVGQRLNPSGLTIRAFYSDGTSKTVSDGFHVGELDSASVGTKTITVTYEGKTTSFTVDVQASENPVNPNAPQIVIENKSASKGSSIDVPVIIKNNPGIAGATLVVSYDKSTLTLNNIVQGSMFENGSYSANPATAVMQWYHTENITEDGVLFTLQFKVSETAQEGSYDIAVGVRDGIPANLSNADFEVVNAQFISGVLEITSSIRGDVTGDGVVAINDVVKLARAVAGSLTLTETERTVADVTGDGVIAINDVIKLARYVAGNLASLQSAEAALLSGGESAVIEVATVSGKPRETLQVPVSVTSNPGIAGAQLDITFDKGLTLKNIVKGDVLSDGTFNPDVDNGRIQWYYDQANVTNTGVLFTLEFEVSADAKNGDAYAVTVNVKDGITANLSDYDFNPVNADFNPGKIQIGEASSNAVISTVNFNGNTVTVNVVCSDKNASVFCGVYNNSGKMIAVRSVQVTGESSYQFQFDGQQFDYAKVFILDSNFCPLCESKSS